MHHSMCYSSIQYTVQQFDMHLSFPKLQDAYLELTQIDGALNHGGGQTGIPHIQPQAYVKPKFRWVCARLQSKHNIAINQPEQHTKPVKIPDNLKEDV